MPQKRSLSEQIIIRLQEAEVPFNQPNQMAEPGNSMHPVIFGVRTCSELLLHS